MSTLEEAVDYEENLEERAEVALREYLGKYAENTQIVVQSTIAETNTVDFQIKWANGRGYWDRGCMARFTGSSLTHKDFFIRGASGDRRFGTALELARYIKTIQL